MKVTRDTSPVRIKPTSRYRKTHVYLYDPQGVADTVDANPGEDPGNVRDSSFSGLQIVRFWGTWESIDFPVEDDDLYVTLTSSDVGRWDLLAHRHYRDVSLWWVIPHANGILDPMVWEVDKVIRIPSRRTVEKVLLENR